jgi:hypothetical protein
VQIHAPSHDEKAQARSGNLPDIAAAMEGLEQTLLVGLGNTAAVVGHDANGLVAVTFHDEFHALAGWRIFHGVREQIGEDVAEQTFVPGRVFRRVVQSELDGATPVGG